MQPGSRSRSRRGAGRTSLALMVLDTSSGTCDFGYALLPCGSEPQQSPHQPHQKAGDPEPLLPLLRKLPDLEELSISSKKFDNGGMGQLKDLQRLATLIVSHSSVDDDGLKELAALPR